MSAPTPNAKKLKGYFRSLETLYLRMRDATAQERVQLLRTGAPGTKDEVDFAAHIRILFERADELNRDGGASFVRGMKISRTGSYLLAVQDERVIPMLFGEQQRQRRGGKKVISATARKEMLSRIDSLKPDGQKDPNLGSTAEFPVLPSTSASSAPVPTVATADGESLSVLDVLKQTLAPAPAEKGKEKAEAEDLSCGAAAPAGKSWADIASDDEADDKAD